MECWKPVPSYEGYYEVSSNGRIRSVDHKAKTAIRHNDVVIKKGRAIKLNLKKTGYLVFTASKENKVKTLTVHRLVAQAFIPNPENKPTVNHKNGNKTDNRVENLEWTTSSENTLHAIKTGLMTGAPLRKKILCSNGMVFESSYKAAEWLNKTKFEYSKSVDGMGRNIRACCKGKTNSAFGYRWKDLI